MARRVLASTFQCGPQSEGAYFRSEADVKQHVAQLSALEARGVEGDWLSAAREMLQAAVSDGRGLITF